MSDVEHIENIIYEHTVGAGEVLAIDDVEELARAIAAAQKLVITGIIERLENITVSPESDDWWIQGEIDDVVRDLKQRG